jgi:NADPH:quinone reductase-like Zn-dependent oxidoreductase
VLRNGVGGFVAAVGQGVDAAQVGRRVITSLRGTGGYAERSRARRRVDRRAGRCDAPRRSGAPSHDRLD